MNKSASLNRLLNPKKIAVIGASNSMEKVGGIVFHRLMDSKRRLFPVNPKETAIQGHKVCQDIKALPDDIDLAVITISAKAAVTAVEQCIQKNIANYIIVAGGFAEVGGDGKELEEKLKKLAKDHGVNILGPNSLGIFLPDENIDTIFVEHGDSALDTNGTVACIVQSGSMGVEALGYASNTGYGMRAFIGLGNKCDLDEMDFLDFFYRDEKTNCIGFYLENIEKGRAFLKAAKKVTHQIPVVVLKAGRTLTAAQAVSSHTGKLAGSDNVISGAFKQFGIQRVYDDEEFCDATKALSMFPGAPGNRVAVLTGAGGYGVMCTDFIEKENTHASLVMAQLSDETKTKIREATFPFTSCDNPVDITASAGDDMFSKCLDAMLLDDNVDIIICIAFFSPPGVSVNLIDIIAQKTKSTHKPLIVFTKYGPFTDNNIKYLFYAGVVGYPSIGRAVRAARILVERETIKQRLAQEGKNQEGKNQKEETSVLKQSKPENIKSEKIKPARITSDTIIPDKITKWQDNLLNPGRPDEFEAKHLVSMYDIRVPEGNRSLPGDPPDFEGISPPYVLKVCSPDIFHKTDEQGVLLDNGRQVVENNFKQLARRFENHPILIEHQTPFMGPEFIIGIFRDPVLGHAVMVGAGGILTEVYKDTSFRLVPCSANEASQMIDELVMRPVFENFRGMTLDKEKLAQTIAKVSLLASDLGDQLNQLDINPIVFSKGEWVALDVKLVLDGHL